VRERRLLLDLTQADVALRAKRSLRTIEELEAERHNPSLRVMCDLAGALKVDVAELLAPPEEEPTRKRAPRKAARKKTAAKKIAPKRKTTRKKRAR
jgi:transcriptional regulator with XRE-family HTH domain